MRHHLLLTALCVAACLGMAATVEAAPRGVVLADTELDGETPLAAGTLVEVLARSETLHRSSRLDWLGARRILVRSGDVEGWIPGEDLAVDVRSPSTTHDLGWRYAALPAGVWFAVSERQEWNDKLEEFDRALVHGYLVTSSPAGNHRLELGHLSGWGSETQLLRSTSRDLTGDGVPELLLSVDENVTEVGYGGRRLQVIRWVGPKAAIVLDLRVYNPTGNGLKQTTFGSVHVDGASIRHDLVELGSGHCGEDRRGRRMACVSHIQRTITWSPKTQDFVTLQSLRLMQNANTLGLDWFPLGAEPDRNHWKWVTWSVD